MLKFVECEKQRGKQSLYHRHRICYLLFYKQRIVLHEKTNEPKWHDHATLSWEHFLTVITEIQKLIRNKE